MLQRRCTQRQFLLRPDDATNQTFLYCLAIAAQRARVDILLTVAMSNHHHTVLYDREGRVVEFIEHLHRLTAKAMNRLRGRWENFWSSEAPSLVRLVDRDDVIRKLTYAATNPVKDNLVERVHQWPGVNSLSALLNHRALVARRPRQFFRSGGPMPDAITLDFVIPPELGDPDAVRRDLRRSVAESEARFARERAETGARVLGRRGVLRQSPNGRPTTSDSRPAVGPILKVRCVWSRLERLLRSRAFLDAYHDARARWIAGLPTLFPAGTYWLRRFAGVPVATVAA
jgi:REP element-mobilizing transposase RayT